jgi:RHS repeat-associated protein
VDGVSYTWDDNGNLLSDGQSTYTYDSANRLTAVSNQSSAVSFAYNGQGDRISQTVGITTTNYILDLAGGLTQVLDDGTNTYLYGMGRIGEQQPGGWQYHLGDALGSVRQLTNAAGDVLLAKGYQPYGETLTSAGSATTSYGYTGEYTDSTGFVYLRARYYMTNGRFTSRDTYIGSLERPMSMNLWLYGYSNPIRWVDGSGHHSKDPNCFAWPELNLGFGSMRDLCQTADWEDNRNDNLDMMNHVPENVLDAREAIYRTIIRGSTGYSLIKGVGYAYVARMFAHFLDGNGNPLAFRLYQSHPFVNDPGITRATRSLSASWSASLDAPNLVVPLLLRFMFGHVRPIATSGNASFEVSSVHLQGSDSYFTFSSRKTGREPRPSDDAWWAAFGHVIIDGDFSAQGKYSCTYQGYLTNYRADYHILDHYRWYPEDHKATPLPLGEGLYIPHEWPKSLTLATPHRADEFDVTIDWLEKDTVYTTNFVEYSIVPGWQYYLP